ncbi:MAG: 4Fe-4S dicluster domain-containing protein, partial [bacterium]
NCTKCYACRDGCSMASITEPDSYHRSECIACLRCLENCPQKNISFAMGLFPKRTRVSYDPTRRQVLAALGISIFSVGVFKSNLIKNKKNSNVIRPPGSLAEEEFLAVCIKCGECIKVCLTNVLQPTLLEAGVEGIWTPRLIPRRGDRREVGGCPKYCNLCTRVCPTDAIRFLTLAEKQKFRIGLANLYKDKCLAWAWNTPCFVCYDYCPYYAIRLDEIDGLKRPSVIHEKCIGCGVCEHRCPIEGSAIKVTAQRETREERGKRVRSIIRKDTIIDSSL